LQISLKFDVSIVALLGIIFNYFMKLIVKGMPLLYHNFPGCTCILYLTMVERNDRNDVEK